MKNISLKGNMNFDKKKDINDYELFSLRITDSLYKKEIGNFLQTLSSHFIYVIIFFLIFKFKQYN